jgi:hypothetical protein
MKNELIDSEASKVPYSLNYRDKNNIKKIIEKAMGYKYPYNINDEEIRNMFENLFCNFPNLDVIKFQDIVKNEFNFIPSHAIARVVNRWNQISPSGKNIDIGPFLTDYKNHLHKILSNFMSALQSAKYLKNIFDAKWENAVKKIIADYDGNEAFGTDTYTAFIGFLQESMDERDFIKRLDEDFGVIFEATKKRKTLKNKLEDSARPLAAYLGSVFETFIVAPCARAGFIIEYEPRVGNNKAEALIKIGQTELLIEASVMTTGRHTNFCGAIGIEEYSNKIYLKIEDKAKQLKNSNYPVILFIVPPFLITPPELKLGLQKALQSAECDNIAGIVISDDYKAHCLKLAKNPNCKYPTEESMWGSLVELYALKPLQIENIWE